MADIGTVFVRIKMDTSEFNKSADEAKKRTEENKSSIGELQKGYGLLAAKIGAAVVAFKKIVTVLRESVQLYGRQIQAEQRLRNALELSGREADRLYPKYIDLANEIQTLTTVGDEAAIELLGLATSLEIAEEKIEEAVKGAIGLNEVFGIGTEQALRGVANAFQGNFSQLERYIPALRTAESEGEKLAILQRTLGSSFDVAKGQAETAFGALKQYENAAGDLKEELGRVVVEGAEPFIRALTNFASKTVEALSEARKFRDMMNEWANTGEVTVTELELLNKSLDDAKKEMGALEGLTTGDQKRAEELQEYIKALEQQIRTIQAVEAMERRYGQMKEDERKQLERLREVLRLNDEARQEYEDRKFARLSDEEKRLQVLNAEIFRLGSLRNQLRENGEDYQGIRVLINDLVAERNDLIESMKEEEEQVEELITVYDDMFRAALRRTDAEQLAHEIRVDNLKMEADAVKKLQDEYVEMATTISGFATPVLESFGEAVSGVQDGWVNLGKTAVMAVAAILQSLAREALVRGAKALASPFTRAQAPQWFAAAGLATVSAGIVKGLANQIKAAALGADFVTSGPQLLMVGDNPGGRERVSVEPLSSSNVHGGKASDMVHVVVNLDGKPILDTVQRASKTGQLLINARSVV